MILRQILLDVHMLTQNQFSIVFSRILSMFGQGAWIKYSNVMISIQVCFYLSFRSRIKDGSLGVFQTSCRYRDQASDILIMLRNNIKIALWVIVHLLVTYTIDQTILKYKNLSSLNFRNWDSDRKPWECNKMCLLF